MRLGILNHTGWLAAGLLACASAPAPEAPPHPREAYRRPATVPHPAANASSEARVELGRRLFFDPRLSSSNDMACGSCHVPARAWGDGQALAIGHADEPLARRTPTILNAAWLDALMWDGRFDTLEEQALAPIGDPAEMAMDLERLPAKLAAIAEYEPRFEAAYPGEGITLETIAKALASFQRSVVSAPAPFDAWVEGDEDAISPAAKRGFALFDGELRCSRCHSGWRFTDDSFHDIGVRGDDRGRGLIFDEIEASQHAFKTPTLRSVDQRGPYMHNGSEASLEAVLELYEVGGRVERPSLSPEMVPFELSAQERADLLAFLRTLTPEAPPLARQGVSR